MASVGCVESERVFPGAGVGGCPFPAPSAWLANQEPFCFCLDTFDSEPFGPYGERRRFPRHHLLYSLISFSVRFLENFFFFSFQE